MKIKLLFVCLFSSAIFALTLSPARAITFDPNNIISDEEMLDSTSLSLAEIDIFLKSQGGYISNHSLQDAYGTYRTGAEIIYNAANNYNCDGIDMATNATFEERKLKCEPAGINPKLLLVLLQKEQSMIEEKNPTQKQLDWATGYGVCDNCSMNDPSIQRFKGFGKQINSAALQFFDYLKNPHHYSYRQGVTYNVSNTGRPPILVTPQNSATAALYNYTPHVYNGNFNFFTLWLRYFTRNYGNLTLLQARGEPGVWLIQEGKRRPFLSKGALTSRFDPKKIIQVSKTDLEKYPIGSSIKFAQYSFVRSPRGTVFLLVDDTRRGFASSEALRKIGVHPEEIIDASWDDLNVYIDGKPIYATTTYPMGALLQDKTTGGVFYVNEGTKAPLWDSVLLKTKFWGQAIIQETPEKLASYTTVAPAIFNDGELLKGVNSPAVYVVDNKKKRSFTSGALFEELGYDWGNIITVPQKIMDLYPDGEPIVQIYVAEEEVEIIDPYATSTPEVATTTEDIQDETTEIPVVERPTERIYPGEFLTEEIDNILNP